MLRGHWLTKIPLYQSPGFKSQQGSGYREQNWNAGYTNHLLGSTRMGGGVRVGPGKDAIEFCGRVVAVSCGNDKKLSRP